MVLDFGGSTLMGLRLDAVMIVTAVVLLYVLPLTILYMSLVD